ncbi:MAG TPA: YCF48-related protein, partial [Planctomycetota bacterium]|nr:YCF48-related protein [Planctomycetota bacterium]
MKNRSIGSLILLAILAPGCGGSGGGGTKHPITPPRWSEQYRRPTSVDLRAVRFGTDLSGIVAGKFGTFVRTDDGGATWQQLESVPNTPTGDILSMAVSSTTVFAVGGAPAGAANYTLSVAWQSLDATTFSQPDSLPTVFAEPWVDVGLAIPATNTNAAGTLRLRPSGLIDVFQGTLALTVDSRNNPPGGGGPVPPTPWTSANGLAIFGTGGYWLVCGNNAGAGQIRRTKDSGASQFDSLTISPACLPLQRMSMLSPQIGFACGDSGTVIGIAPDPANVLPLGDYWTKLAGNPITQNLKAIQVLSEGTGLVGWVAGDAGTIYRIRNAGTATPAWDAQVSNTTQNLYDIYFVDQDNGFAVGDNGTVVRTTNGTASPPTWTVVSGPAVNPTPVFNAVDVSASGAFGLVVGNSGTLLRSLDGGITWSSFATGVGGANLTAVSIPRAGSGKVAFVGTDTGGLFVNPDVQGTGTWQAATGTFPPPAGTQSVKTILFPKGDSAGIAAGTAGSLAILNYSTLGGLTLVAPTPPPAQAGTNYSAACDPTGNTLYVCGDNGYVISSTDGGTTWAAVVASNPTPNVSFRAVQAPTGPTYTLFAGAGDGNVYRLSTGTPGTWTSTSATNFGTPAGLAFINDTTGWALTQDPVNGGIFITT